MTSGQLHLQPQHTMEVGNSNQVWFVSLCHVSLLELLSKGSKKKTTFLILLVVLVFVVVAAILYFVKPSSTPLRTQEPLKRTSRGMTLRSFVEGEYLPGKFNGTWISDHEALYKSASGNIMIFDAKSNTSRILLGRDLEVVSTSFSYEISADRKYLLFAHNYQKLYRYSYLAFYNFVELDTLKVWPLTDMTGEEIPVQLVTWAPNGNAFVYVYMNDIYYKPSPRQLVQEQRLTRTGRPGTIYNGVPDWVYEEEVFSSNEALWFSPDGNYLAYATFNDSRTPVMNIPYYGLPGDVRYQYMQAVNIRYPKPGRPNPTVSLNVVDLGHLLTQKAVREIDLPARPTLKEPVLFRVDWAGPSSLIYIWMNRIQNEAEIFQYSTTTGQFRQLMGLQEKYGWVTMEPLKFSPDHTKMAMIIPVDQGDAGKFRHLTLVDLNDPNPLPIALTSGKFVVTEIAAYDDTHIYFMSNANGHPGELRVYRVPATMENAPHRLECVSCPHEQTENGKCLYSGASFSKSASYYVLSCAGPVIPQVDIYKKTGEHVIKWNSNSRLKKKLDPILMPKHEYMEYEVAPGMFAQIQLVFPPNADLSGAIKYPLLVQVYGGPDSNAVLKRFNVDWDSYLTVNRSIIYARIDGRGSGLRGDKITFANYRRLGTYEVEDQINTTRYLVEKLPYIDPTKVAIWGWSYGGFVSAMALAQDNKDVFKCGISVAPVTDWLLYDTLYTERFMGLPFPDDNLVGYERASLFNKISNFSKKKFMLIHGTLDDNVHYQQSMMLAKTLELKDILFDQLSYPDEAHSLSDVRPHLYHSMGHFLDQCFRLETY